MEGHTTAVVTAESRARTQLCITRGFLKNQGDVSLLHNFWARLSSFTDYQATLSDFEWGQARLTVSVVRFIFPYMCTSIFGQF